jgi:chromosome segregation ATPase
VRAYVAGAAAPAADRPVPELRAAIAGIVDALEAKVATANAEAQGWLEAALLARGKAEEARQEAQRLAGDLAYIRTERDALRSEADALQGKLGAAEADRDAWRHRALIAEAALGTQVREVDPWRAEIEARLAKLETMGTGMGTDPTARAREPKQGRSE